MGEVYRAIDTNLKRAIAIKVLPTSVAADAERLARFQREAEVLASLNHPHIAAIYGLEDADGVKALVLELVEGPTLADRIAQGPIPLDEAIPIARQIAEAVEAAHEQGIIHRDLKPANIKLRSDGTVKVLDFGLAKALDPLPTSIDASQSAAITSPAMTGMGVIMGTAAYMSAEQARGKAVDKRSDIWAFGCVLYEMLTGRRAFEGEDISDTLANVLKIDPNWQALPAEVPAAIRALLRRCLDKDRRTRVADISTALFVLDEAAGLRGAVEGPAEVGPYVRGEVSRWRRVVPAAGALIVGGAIVGGAVWWTMRTASPAVVRTTIRQIPIERSSDVRVLVKSDFCNQFSALSPNRLWMAYQSNVGREEIYVERYPELGSRQKISTDGGVLPLWSRNGRELFFGGLDGRQMFVVPIQSGTTLVAGRPECCSILP